MTLQTHFGKGAKDAARVVELSMRLQLQLLKITPGPEVFATVEHACGLSYRECLILWHLSKKHGCGKLLEGASEGKVCAIRRAAESLVA